MKNAQNALVSLAILGALGYAVWTFRQYAKGIDTGLDFLDPWIVGGDDFSDPNNSPGWLTSYYAWKAGNPDAGTYGTPRGSVWDWDPLGMLGQGSRWGIWG